MKKEDALKAYRDLFIYTEDAVLERIDRLEYELEMRFDEYKLSNKNINLIEVKIKRLRDNLTKAKEYYEDNL